MNVANQILSMKNERSRIITLAIPAIINQITITLVQVVDMIFIGQLGALAIGAVGLVGTLIWNILTIADGFSVGLSACISRMIGAKNTSEASIFLKTGTITTLVVGTAILPALLVFQSGLFAAIQLPPELQEFASDYFGTFMLFLPVIFMRSAVDAAFRAAGDTKTSMMTGFLINAVNLVLDWLLIFGNLGFPAMGMKGAALASGISVLIGAVVQVLLTTGKPWGLFTHHSLFSLPHLYRTVKIGIPSIIEQFAMALSQLTVMALTVNPLGGNSVASFQIVMRLASLSFTPGFGFAIAASTLSGQHLGAREPERAAASIWLATIYCGLVMAGITILYFAIPGPLIALFTNDTAVISLTEMPLRVYALTAIFLAPTMVLGGGLRGAGDTRFTMGIMFLSRFLVRVPLSYLLGITLGFGLPGIWLGMSSDFIVRGFLLAIRTAKGKWKTMSV